MKTKLFVAALALATVLLPGCGIILDDSPGLVTVSTGHATVVTSSDDDYYYDDESYHHGRGGYDDVYVSNDTTVIAQPAPVIIQQPVYTTPAQTNTSASVDPIIQSFTANPTNNVQPGQPITFTVVATDPNHQAMQFNWSATGGTLSTNTGRVVTWQPPTEAGTYTVSAVITNGKGGVVTGSQNLVVSEAVAPVAAKPVPVAAAPVQAPAASTPSVTAVQPTHTTRTTTTTTTATHTGSATTQTASNAH